jgi:hypothetical protein
VGVAVPRDTGHVLLRKYISSTRYQRNIFQVEEGQHYSSPSALNPIREHESSGQCAAHSSTIYN